MVTILSTATRAMGSERRSNLPYMTFEPLHATLDDPLLAYKASNFIIYVHHDETYNKVSLVNNSFEVLRPKA